MLQASNPKDQYLLLKALNEVLMSLTSDMGNKQLAPTHQQEVICFTVSVFGAGTPVHDVREWHAP